MSYTHDVFISYRRHRQWQGWARDHFKPALEAHLFNDLGRDVDIFIDERLEIGRDWVDSLAIELARSKIVVALFSRPYFESDWCIHELDLIIDRAGGAVGSFFPIVVHDCEGLKSPLSRSNAFPMEEHYRVPMLRDTPKYEAFSDEVRKLSPKIASMIYDVENNAPFQQRWEDIAKQRLNAVFAAREDGRRYAPSHVNPELPPPFSLPPRLAP